MSRFPSRETFKRKKSKPYLEVEKHIPNFSSSYLANYGILPKKTKDTYIYDIVGQKFTDFYLNYGRLFLGYTDKYITRMVKNYLKHTINSYSKGIFTYRLISLVTKMTGGKFKYVSVGRSDYEVFSKMVKFFGPCSTIVNSKYLKGLVDNKSAIPSSRKIFIIEPHDEVFNINYHILSRLSKVRLQLLRKGGIFRGFFILPSLAGSFFRPYRVMSIGSFGDRILDYSCFLRNPVILSLSRIGVRFKYFSFLKRMKVDALVIGISNGYTILLHNYENLRFFDISEFESMVCYYHLLREKFLVSKKESELMRDVDRSLSKFYKLGILKKLSPYGALVEHDKFSNERLIEDGVFTVGNVIYFSFSHSINDLLRLKRKFNLLFFGD